ncbi:ABC transporter ATP-binding protein/permease, partial [Salibacteraceae bacterium]|nr:ABC transporter ATP-binding protein/permease [Salibacteraceae bacterium]
PVVLVLVKDGAIQSNTFLRLVHEWTGLMDENYFIILLCVLLLFVLVLKNIATTFITYYQAKFTFELQTFFSQNLFRAFYQRGLPYFKKMNSQNVLRNINGVPSSFSTGIVLPILNVLTEMFIVLFILAGLLYYDYKVVILIAALVIPAFGLFYSFSKNKIKHFQEDLYRLAPEMSRVSFEAIYGFTDVKVTGTEEGFFKKHKLLQEEMVGHNILVTTYKAVPPKVIEFSMFLGISVIIAYGVFTLDNRSDLIALLGLFALAAYRILPSINRFMLSIMTIKSFEYTIEVMERKDAQLGSYSTKSNKVEEIDFRSLTLRNLSFLYENQTDPVLIEINLEVSKGEVIGIIGESGSGKSTLMNLILGFFPVQQDQLLVNGKPLNEDALASWQKSLGYVSQDVFMMDATIKENVAFGQEVDQIDDDLVWECLEKASLATFVRGFKDSINTVVGERGGLLSGGQKQRIGIARSLYSGAQVLLFDEATSALDTETEREITESIQRLKKDNFTMIMIAHRVTSLKFCDRIIELADGKIKGELTYQSLIEQTI